MANFRPKKPITQDTEYFYEDTLENFLKPRPGWRKQIDTDTKEGQHETSTTDRESNNTPS
jgi:hypothetical protein